ncbi:MAG: phosphatidylserine decarboxylase [Mollicutes bacterium]|nr:phosphatidylserine decarboxylase [Mollicutes bacterium]
MKEDKTTLFLYKTFIGRIILKIITLRLISKIIGLFLSTRLSKFIISIIIKKNNIDMSEYVETKYKSFNDFFTRNIKQEKRNIELNKNILISPCDANLSVYRINKDNKFYIKGSSYSINELLKDNISKDYLNGYICIFRLCVDNYHHYCYIDNGYKSANNYIQGILHTVRPIALKKYNIYHQNSREWSILHTENFGDVIQIEIGALLVGKIVNHHSNYQFKKGEEKGYFEYGGSTICLLFKKNTIRIEDDILNNTKNDIETTVKYGERIGKKIS